MEVRESLRRLLTRINPISLHVKVKQIKSSNLRSYQGGMLRTRRMPEEIHYIIH
jgi:hypothetical protein